MMSLAIGITSDVFIETDYMESTVKIPITVVVHIA